MVSRNKSKRHGFVLAVLCSLFVPGHASLINRLTSLEEKYRNLELRMEVRFYQRKDGQMAHKYTARHKLLIHEGGIRKESTVYRPDGTLNYEATQVYDGQRTVQYRPDQKTATIDGGRNLNLGDAGVPLMAVGIGHYPASRFSPGPPATLEALLEESSSPPVPGESTPYGITRPVEPEDLNWSVFPADDRDRTEAFFATGLFNHGHIMKGWTDSSRSGLIVRQDFFDKTGSVSARFEVEDIARGFVRSFRLMEFEPSGDEKNVSQLLEGIVETTVLNPLIQPQDFHIELPTEAYVIDRDKDLTYTVGGLPAEFAEILRNTQLFPDELPRQADAATTGESIAGKPPTQSKEETRKEEIKPVIASANSTPAPPSPRSHKDIPTRLWLWGPVAAGIVTALLTIVLAVRRIQGRTTLKGGLS